MNVRDIAAGKITLAENTKPALSPGTWHIKVTQTVSGNEKLKDSGIKAEELTFSCEADPYAMDPDQVYSVYPPKDSFGMFGNVLPNIVLKRRTLPWERTVPGCPGIPWIALLLFSEDEGVTVRTVKRPKAGGQSDTEDQSYMELEVPPKLFGRICPPAEDMKLSVHSRYTDRENKVTEKKVVEDWMSVVACGRLPRSGPEKNGFKNTVYLVSMEGAGSMLAGKMDFSVRQDPVRLPVLASWSFYSKKEEYDFRTVFNGLQAGPLASPVPPKAGERAAGLINRGYRPLNHRLRDGGNSVSWYHGPFRPWNPGIRENTYELFSDAGLIYEPELGMFDVSVAAAFNLGRMLALKDGSFADTLERFREENKREAAKICNRQMLQSAFETASGELQGRECEADAEKRSESKAHTKAMKAENIKSGLSELAARIILDTEKKVREAAIKEYGRKPSKDQTGPEPCPRIRSLVSVPPVKGRFSFLTEENSGVQIPDLIIKALSEWSLFYGVPYRYLVPGPEFLPKESIRFFYVDHDWLTAMLDGAMSLGRIYDVDYEHDSELIETVLEKVFEKRLEVRPRLQGKSGDELQSVLDKRKSHVFAGSGRKDEFLSTGFLLRSELVTGWRGLELRAYADVRKTVPLVPLRMETLGQDILLGIFAGECSCLEIGQPPEGMHFGFEKNPQGGYRKLLRNLSDGALSEDPKLYAGIVMRNEEDGIMSWEGTAGNIKKALPEIGTPTSAHMALEMVQNPAAGEICKKEIR